MNKRMQRRTKRRIAILLLFAILFSADIPVWAAASNGAASDGKAVAENAGSAAQDDISGDPVNTASADQSATPDASQPTASQDVTQTPDVSQQPEETPAAPPVESPVIPPEETPAAPPEESPVVPPEETTTPLAAPKKISQIYLCSLGQKKVKLTWPSSKNATSYEIYRKKKGGSSFRLIGTTKKCTYKDTSVTYNKTYRYKMIPVAEAYSQTVKGKATFITFRNVKVVATDHQKYSYTEMKADIKLLEKNYHGLVQYEVIGQSEDGRNIYDVIIGNPDASKTMLVISTLHAREYMASLLCMNQIEYYLQNYQGTIDGKKVKKTLNSIAIHYIPMANPDGVTISQFGISKIRSAALRKNLYRMSRGSTALWKANARGVDLNLNFPYLFKTFGKRGSSGFSGPSKASESETKAVVKLLRKLKKGTKLKGVVNYHAMGSIVFGGCRKSGTLSRDISKMYTLARSTTGYASAAGYKGTTSLGRGNCREYVMYVLSVPSITLEIGRYACPGPIREFPSIWSRNRNLVLREARLFV